MIQLKDLIRKGYTTPLDDSADIDCLFNTWLSPNKKYRIVLIVDSHDVKMEFSNAPATIVLKDIEDINHLEKAINWILLGSKAHLL